MSRPIPALTLEVSTDYLQYNACHVLGARPPFPDGVAESQVTITGRTVIGRRHGDGRSVEGVDVYLPDDPADVGMSHRHCIIDHDDRGWHVHDAGSRNGTWHNGWTVDAGDDGVPLDVGDHINIGLWTRLTVIAIAGPRPARCSSS